jgi:hypothetical protein
MFGGKAIALRRAGMNVIGIHGHDFVTNDEKQKTYGRFLGMIFGRELVWGLEIGRQQFAFVETGKMGNSRKKVLKSDWVPAGIVSNVLLESVCQEKI